MANVEFHQGNTLKDITVLTILVTVFFGNVPSLYIPFIRQRQEEAGKIVGNVLSLYIPFISYQAGCGRKRQEEAGRGRKRQKEAERGRKRQKEVERGRKR